MKSLIYLLLSCVLACNVHAATEQNGTETAPPPLEKSYSLQADGAAVVYRAKLPFPAPFYQRQTSVYNEVQAKPEDFVGKDYSELCDSLYNAGCNLTGVKDYPAQGCTAIKSSVAFFYSENGKHYVKCADITAYVSKGSRLVQKIDLHHPVLSELSEKDVQETAALREWHQQSHHEYMIFGHVMFLECTKGQDGERKWSFR